MGTFLHMLVFMDKYVHTYIVHTYAHCTHARTCKFCDMIRRFEASWVNCETYVFTSSRHDCFTN